MTQTSRPQAQRRAATRRLAIIAAIRCLARDGYGATSLEQVIVEAGISRGRLLHAFPTKVDLMLAVGNHAWSVAQRLFRWMGRHHTDPGALLTDHVDFAWRIMNRPPGIAVLEILLACRSDAGLAQVFVPAHRAVQDHAEQRVQRLIDRAGLTGMIDGRAYHRFVAGAVRGLVIDRSFAPDGEARPEALLYIRSVTRRMLEPPASDQNR